MKILAIEASGLTAGCAVACDGKLIGDYNIQYQKTHSQTLVPMLDELKRMEERLTCGGSDETGQHI